MSTPVPGFDPSLGEDLPEDLRARVKAELEPDERLIWAGRAIQARVGQGTGMRTASLWLGGLWGATLVGAAYRHGVLGPINEVAVPLVTVGALICGIIGGCVALGMTFMLLDRIKTRQSFAQLAYALTDRRAILWRPRPGTGAVEVYTIPGRSLDGIHRVEYADGSGDVGFQGTATTPWDCHGFFGVADVRRVEALARSVLVDPDGRKRRRPDDSDMTMLDE